MFLLFFVFLSSNVSMLRGIVSVSLISCDVYNEVLFCFLLLHLATKFPHANRPHGLKAEAISDEKWGIATDRLFFRKKSARWLFVPAFWAPLVFKKSFNATLEFNHMFIYFLFQ